VAQLVDATVRDIAEYLPQPRLCFFFSSVCHHAHNPHAMSTNNDDSDEYTIPLEDQRVFGAGLKRKRVRFVPSSSRTPAPPSSSTDSASIAERYLSLVIPSDSLQSQSQPHLESQSTVVEDDHGINRERGETEICDICNLPLKATTADSIGADGNKHEHIHEATLPHQLSLPHSHPPSSIQRSRLGLKILSTYGYDPDARRGLGPLGEGRRDPIKVKEKDDKLGLGVVVPGDVSKGRGMVKGRELGGREKGIKKLDAGEVRRRAVHERKRGEVLRQAFYGNEDVERYLRG
jgi:hypothetical protein